MSNLQYNVDFLVGYILECLHADTTKEQAENIAASLIKDWVKNDIPVVDIRMCCSKLYPELIDDNKTTI